MNDIFIGGWRRIYRRLFYRRWWVLPTRTLTSSILNDFTISLGRIRTIFFRLILYPWYFCATSHTNLILFLVDVLKIFLNTLLFFAIMRMKCLQRWNPPLLDELIIACKLPCYDFFRIFGGKIKLFKHFSLSNILSFHHMFSIKLYWKIWWIILIAFDLLNVCDFNWTFRQLLEGLQNFWIAFISVFIPLNIFGTDE